MRRLLPFLLLPLLVSPLLAGGPIGAFGSDPIVWNTENGPIRLLLDRGSLGQFDSADAYRIIAQSIEAWDTVSASRLRIVIDSYLPYDVRNANDPVLVGPSTINDGVVPVVIDDDGSITDAFIGAGASRNVNGFASPFTTDGRTWSDGRVVLNGSRNRNETGITRTTTHELGHLLGLSHTQRTHRADYPLMNPFGGPIDVDDLLALVLLYPVEAELENRGSISGRITDAEGNPLSGVNVLAINLESGEVYSTVSDYFSGGDFRFAGPQVAQEGLYSFEGLPAGTWYLRMEGVNPDWVAGSSLSSYDPPINTGVIDDWYNGENESGAMHLDNLNEKTGITLGPGESATGIDFVENDRTGLVRILDELQSATRDWPVPVTYQGVRAQSYAVRHVAPFTGSPVMTRFRIGSFPSIQDDGDIVVTVYGNANVGGTDVPGNPIGSLRIPPDQIVAGLNYDVWLHEIGGLRFNQGEVFHIGLEVDGPGRLNLIFAEGDDSEGTSYRNNEGDWVPFPHRGNNGGTRSGRLDMQTWYSPIRPGDDRILVASDPVRIDFDPTEVGQMRSAQVTIGNIGTRVMEITDVSITGADPASFRYDTASLVGKTIAPGERITAEVFFTPQSEGAVAAQLNVGGLVTLPIEMTGTGTEPAVGRLVEAIDFGQTLLDSTRSVDTVVIYNRGTVNLVAKPGGISGSGFRLVEPSRDGLFRPGDSIEAIIEFTPSQERSYDEELTFTFQPPRDTIRVRVRGDGVRAITSVPVVAASDLGLSIVVAPNPVRDRLLVSIEGDRRLDADLMLVDGLGRTVARGDIDESGSAVIATDGLAAGVYRLIVVTDEGMVVRGVVVR